jgi:hypothetical protein
MVPIERAILRHLFEKKDYAEQVVPYLKENYFYTPSAGLLYKLYEAYYSAYQKLPSFTAIEIGLDAQGGLTQRQVEDAQAALNALRVEPALAEDQETWIVEQTEEFCQTRAVYLGLQQCVAVMDDPKTPKHAMTDILKDALSVSFDTNVGHDYFDDADDRWTFYHAPESRIPFDLDAFNKMTKGGAPKKTLNILVAGTNVGKSLALCHFAAAAKRMSHNTLYITCEMREEWIGARIDANMMDIPLDDVEQLPQHIYIQKIHHLKSLSTGQLKIKEYAPGTASVADFRLLLRELKQKQNFTPELICIDYLNLVKAAGVKMGGSVNSYQYLKAVSEELRALAVEFNVALWTACQFNRTGFSSATPDLADTGESFAIPQTADFMAALTQTEELEKLSQISVRPLKNRYRKKNSFEETIIGIDPDRMKLYDLSSAQLAQAITLPPAINSQAKSTISVRRPGPLASLKREAEGAT